MSRSARVAKNIATTFISQAISWLLTFAVILFLPRYAGAKGLGELTLAGSYASIFGLLSSLGASTVLMRDIPRDIGSAGRLILTSLLVRVPLAIVAVILGLIVAFLFRYDRIVDIMIGFCLANGIASVITDTLGSAARGLENFAIANVGSVIDKVISSAFVIIVCILKWPLWLVVATPIATACFSATYMLGAIKKQPVKWAAPSFADIKSLVVAGLPFVSAGVFVAVYAKSDAIFLSKLSTIESVGWYGLSTRIAGTAMALPAIVCSAMLPTLSGLFRENRASYIEGVSRLINLMVACSIPFAAVMIFCPYPLIALFSHKTSSFLPAANVIRVYGFALVLWFVSQAAYTSIVACDRQNNVARAMAVAALISLPITAGCVAFSQHTIHNGAVGAAVSDLLVEVYLIVSYMLILPKGTVSARLLTVCARCLVAASPIIAVLNLLPLKISLPLLVPCIGIYAFLCVQLRCFHSSDIDLLRKAVKGKIGFGTA